MSILHKILYIQLRLRNQTIQINLQFEIFSFSNYRCDILFENLYVVMIRFSHIHLYNTIREKEREREREREGER